MLGPFPPIENIFFGKKNFASVSIPQKPLKTHWDIWFWEVLQFSTLPITHPLTTSNQEMLAHLKSQWVCWCSRSWKNEGFLALEPDEERGGNAFAKPAEEKGLAEAQAAEGWRGKNRNGAFPQGENIKIKSMSFWTTETITLTTMVRVLSKLTTQPKTPMPQLLRRSRTSQLVGKPLNWFHHQWKSYDNIVSPICTS